MTKPPKFEAGKLLEGEARSHAENEAEAVLAEDTTSAEALNALYAPLLKKHLGLPVDTSLTAKFVDVGEYDIDAFAHLSPSERQKYANSYTLNPETQKLDFAQLKPFILGESIFDGEEDISSMSEAVRQLTAAFPPSEYYYPGVEYAKWLVDHPDQIPQFIFENQQVFLLLGSQLHTSTGAVELLSIGMWQGDPMLYKRTVERATADNRLRVLVFKKP